MMVMEMIYDDDEVRCVREMRMRKVRESQRERGGVRQIET